MSEGESGKGLAVTLEMTGMRGGRMVTCGHHVAQSEKHIKIACAHNNWRVGTAKQR